MAKLANGVSLDEINIMMAWASLEELLFVRRALAQVDESILDFTRSSQVYSSL